MADYPSKPPEYAYSPVPLDSGPTVVHLASNVTYADVKPDPWCGLGVCPLRPARPAPVSWARPPTRAPCTPVLYCTVLCGIADRLRCVVWLCARSARPHVAHVLLLGVRAAGRRALLHHHRRGAALRRPHRHRVALPVAHVVRGARYRTVLYKLHTHNLMNILYFACRHSAFRPSGFLEATAFGRNVKRMLMPPTPDSIRLQFETTGNGIFSIHLYTAFI